MKKTLTLILAGVLIGSTATFATLFKTFSDVPENAWYTEAVNNLTAKGIINGYEDGTFGPNKNVNRAELAVMLNRTLQYVEDGTVSNSKDNNETTNWASYSDIGISVKYPNDGTYNIEEEGIDPSLEGFTISQEHPGERFHFFKTSDEPKDYNDMETKTINGKIYKIYHIIGMGSGYEYITEHNGEFYTFLSVYGPTNEVFELIMNTVKFE